MGAAPPVGLAASPASGSLIQNQASVSYQDQGGIARSGTSNVVQVSVGQVASLTLTADNARTAATGTTIYTPHTLTNTGNGSDTFSLATTVNTGGYVLTNVRIYPNASGNGIPDSLTPITTTGVLASNGVFRFVVGATVPSGAPVGAVDSVRVDATSTFDTTITTAGATPSVAPNNDSITVSPVAAIAVTKSLSASSGPSPSGPLTVTLSYINNGGATAAALTLVDVLPAGMRYVAGSGRWSRLGATALTDALLSPDDQGIAPDTITYNYGVSAPGAVTAVINQVPAAASGSLTFQVTIDPGLPTGTLNNKATYQYQDSSAAAGPFTTNTASYTVSSAAGAAITGSVVPTASAGSIVQFIDTVTNTGTGPDSLDVTLSGSTFPVGTVFQLLQADGVTPLSDTNGNGVPDSGTLGAGGSIKIIVNATLPLTAAGGPYSVTTTARSKLDPTKTATALNTVSVVTPPTAAKIVVTSGVSSNSAGPNDTVIFNTTIANAGNGIATGSATITVDGVSSTQVLLRDPIPANLSLTGITTRVPGAIVLYHIAGSPENTYTANLPANLRSVDAVGTALPTIPLGFVSQFAFSAKLNANAAINSSGIIQNTAALTYIDAANPAGVTVKSNSPAIAIAPVLGAIRNYSGLDFSQPADFVPPGATLFLRVDAASCNVNPSIIETRVAIITGPNNERETYTAKETGLNTGVFIISGIPTQNAPVVPADGIIEAKNGASISVDIQGCNTKITTTIQLVDPSGVVFDSRSNAPVNGAKVTLVKAAGGICTDQPASVTQLVGNTIQPAGATVLTGTDGRYAFPLVSPGDYCLQVIPPPGYGFASTVAVQNLPAGRQIVFTDANHGGSYGGVFTVGPTSGPVTVDIPVDARTISGLFVEKTSSRTIAEIGDVVDYTVRINNNTGAALTSGLSLTDRLPAGFSYQLGSLRINGVAAADPIGGRTPILTVAAGAPAPGVTTTLTYRVKIGPGAAQGDGINRVRATAGAASSNEASARVQIQGGVFSSSAFIIGKVFLDCNRNGIQDDGEFGIPGVRLYLEDGTNVTTDSEGKYNLYGISPRNHVLKLDKTSMPVGSELTILSNRNAGDAGSRFVDLKAGELHKADFAEGSCAPSIVEAVKSRRLKAEAVSEAVRAAVPRLDVDATVRPLSDVRALPASGVSTVGIVGNAGVAPTPSMSPTQTSAREISAPVPVVAAPIMPLENQLLELDNTLDFIDPKEGATLAIAQTRVRVKGTAGNRFTLLLNGTEIPAARIGKKSVLPSKNMQAWEFIGVDLKPGSNKLEVREIDPFGNERGRKTITLIAPDQLRKIKLDVIDTVPADGHSAAHVLVELVDGNGVPVTTRTPVTLEASLGQWDAEDLDRREPGVQVFIEGGRARFSLIAPAEPGQSKIRITSGKFQSEGTVDFLPDLRPMIAAGLIEGVLNFHKLDPRALVPARTNDGFEQELRNWMRRSGDGKTDAAARAAVFLKGKVKGDYLLTLGYDSDKTTRDRLFRDIQPDEFYPVYGDASVRGFDAQSTGRLYVRVDKNKSYLLYGDLTTQAATPARKLSNYSRSLTGVKEHYENSSVSVNAFASKDSTKQVVEEIRANGTSGPFVLKTSTLLENSEKVEVLVRDRNQPAVILSTLPLARFSDYEIEPLTGSLLLKAPLASLDPTFNAQSLRITYEVDQGGQKFWVAGVDAQLKLTNTIEIGGVAVTDRNPQDPSKLLGANATIKLGEKTFITGEVAQTDKLSTGKGVGRRIELQHDSTDLQLNAYAGRTDANFDNPGAILSQGRAEAGLRARYVIDDKTALKAEALRTEDIVNGGRRDGVLLSVERNLGEGLRFELGLRHATETSAPAQVTSTGTGPADVTSVRAKLTAPVPTIAQATAYGEYEQDVHDASKKIAALGAEYQFANRGRAYLRHEFISSLSGPYGLNTSQKQNATVFGVDTDYMKDGHVFSEYRIRDAYSGGDAQAALGLRNQWPIAEGVKLSTGIERVHTLSGTGSEEATAGSVGIEYTADPRVKATGRLELREATTSNSVLSTIGVALKLSRDWTLLARNALAITRNKDSAAGERIQERAQLGFAFRDTTTDVYNALGRIEHRIERDDTQPALQLKRSIDLLSLSANMQLNKSLLISTRYAVKRVIDNSNDLHSSTVNHLAGARATYDLDDHWDVGVVGNVLVSNGLRTRQYGLGLELGYLISTNLWLSAGYNVTGFTDNDLAGADYTNRGLYLRLRFKFDEDLLKGGSKPSSATVSPASAELR